jgi:hypothetical protein
VLIRVTHYGDTTILISKFKMQGHNYTTLSSLTVPSIYKNSVFKKFTIYSTDLYLRTHCSLNIPRYSVLLEQWSKFMSSWQLLVLCNEPLEYSFGLK